MERKETGATFGPRKKKKQRRAKYVVSADCNRTPNTPRRLDAYMNDHDLCTAIELGFQLDKDREYEFYASLPDSMKDGFFRRPYSGTANYFGFGKSKASEY